MLAYRKTDGFSYCYMYGTDLISIVSITQNLGVCAHAYMFICYHSTHLKMKLCDTMHMHAHVHCIFSILWLLRHVVWLLGVSPVQSAEFLAAL